jgi:hypothetical protein
MRLTPTRALGRRPILPSLHHMALRTHSTRRRLIPTHQHNRVTTGHLRRLQANSPCTPHKPKSIPISSLSPHILRGLRTNPINRLPSLHTQALRTDSRAITNGIRNLTFVLSFTLSTTPWTYFQQATTKMLDNAEPAGHAEQQEGYANISRTGRTPRPAAAIRCSTTRPVRRTAVSVSARRPGRSRCLQTASAIMHPRERAPTLLSAQLSHHRADCTASTCVDQSGLPAMACPERVRLFAI